MSTTSEVLVDAAVTVMRGWCQLYEAVDVLGNRVRPSDQSATHFCATGAIKYHRTGHEGRDFRAVQRVIARLSLQTRESIICFNDEVADCPEQVAQVLCEAAGL